MFFRAFLQKYKRGKQYEILSIYHYVVPSYCLNVVRSFATKKSNGLGFSESARLELVLRCRGQK